MLQSERKKPYGYIQQVLELAKQHDMKVIVEIGSMRKLALHDLDFHDFDCCNDGHSSLLWARSGLEFHTVDVSYESYQITQFSLNTHKFLNGTAYLQDGIAFLKNFEKKIDILFLDAWDVDLPDSAHNHVLAYEAAKDKLSDKHIISIDDTDVDYVNGSLVWATGVGGKGKELVPILLNDGYKLIAQGRQTVLSKGL